MSNCILLYYVYILFFLSSYNQYDTSQSALIQSCNGLRKFYHDSGIIEQESQELASTASICDTLMSRFDFFALLTSLNNIFLIFVREPESARLLACRIHGTTSPIIRMSVEGAFQSFMDPFLAELAWHQCPEVHKAMDGVRFIASHIKREQDSTRVNFKMFAVLVNEIFFYNRLKKIGNMWPWFWIDCFCGYLL